MCESHSEFVSVNGHVYHLGLKPQEISKNIFLVGDPARVDKVAKHFDETYCWVNNREFRTITGKYKRMPATVISTGIGTDNIEIALLELYILNEFYLEKKLRKNSSKPLTIIRLGTSGGIQEDIKPGMLAISSYALGLDNTGTFYDSKINDDLSHKIEEKAYEVIKDATPKNRRFRGKIHPYVSKASPEIVDALKRDTSECIVGITASAPGFFAPQGRLIEGIKSTIPNLYKHLAKISVNGQRIVNFEMESSILFHLADILGYKAGTICPIITNRSTGEILSKSEYDKVINRCIKIGLKAMLDLYINK